MPRDGIPAKGTQTSCGGDAYAAGWRLGTDADAVL